MIIDRPAALGNFRTGRRARIALIVIHTMEGTLEGTAKWFATPDAMVSSHYGISVDGLVCRFVLDQDTAYHAGNADVNAVSLGIELEGHCDDKDAFTGPMLDACAVLCNQLCAAYGLAPDRKHIIGHAEVPDPRHPGQLGGAGHHRDPGPYFDWPGLMDRIERRRMEVA